MNYRAYIQDAPITVYYYEVDCPTSSFLDNYEFGDKIDSHIFAGLLVNEMDFCGAIYYSYGFWHRKTCKKDLLQRIHQYPY
jgi:hypothetical protein